MLRHVRKHQALENFRVQGKISANSHKFEGKSMTNNSARCDSLVKTQFGGKQTAVNFPHSEQHSLV